MVNDKTKDIGPVLLTGLHHQFHSRMLSHYYSVWRLWAAVFRPWPDSPLLRQPGSQGLPPNHHIDAELSVDILSTWRSMREDPWPQAIHQTQFSSSWVTEARHYLQLWAYLCKGLHVFGCGQKRLMTQFLINTICHWIFWFDTLDQVKLRQIKNFSCSSSPRKSLVKGERFMRYEENSEITKNGLTWI